MDPVVSGLIGLVQMWLDTSPPITTIDAFSKAHPLLRIDESIKTHLSFIIPADLERRGLPIQHCIPK
jgi:hypothetical protein